MYILKNALRSIQRNKGRNILIGCIILIIACAASISLAINNSAESLIASYESKYDIEATIGLNRQKMMGNFDPSNREESREGMREMFSNASSISIEDIENYADSEYVKSYSYTAEIGANSEDIEKASMTTNSGQNADGPMRGGMGRPEEQSNSDFTIKGYSSVESMTEFIDGRYRISEGEVSEDLDGNKCIINSELATLNEIKVGDTIAFTSADDETVTFELEVSGIFTESEEDEGGMSMFSNSANMIITNANFVKKISDEHDAISSSNKPTFTLVSKDNIEAFTEELTEKGLNENLTVETNLDQAKEATSTISNVRSFAIVFLIIILVIGTIVLFVINMINIRERRYEIGVLRTIGMKKAHVSLQFILELLMTATISLILGAGLGATLSVPVSNTLLQNEIASSQQSNQQIMQNFGKGGAPDAPNGNRQPRRFNGTTDVQAFDSINATVDIKVLLQLLLIGIGLTAIGSLSAIASIQRFSPLTILKER